MPKQHRSEYRAHNRAPQRQPVARIFLFALAAAALAAGAAIAEIRSDRWLEDVKYLSSDAMKGRGSGSPELTEAANYIAEQFRETGLEPIQGTYFQPFEATVGAEMGQTNELALAGTAERSYRVNRDFIPLSFSASEEKSGGMAFVGYGITASEYNYDDYAGIDVTGKVVLVLRHEPQEEDEQSVFRGRRITRHAGLVNKAINARNHGAAAMVLVNDPAPHSGDRLIRFGRIDGPGDLGIPVIQVRQSVAEEWMQRAGRSLEGVQRAIDRDLSNQSFLFPDGMELRVQTEVSQKKATLRNVVGLLPGSDPAVRDQVIVIGAHYDHLGLGEENSLTPDRAGEIHNGADDNASGTAGMMELARFFSEAENRPRHSMLFMGFSGEEIGLLGSAHYVDAPLIPNERTQAMINLDMIGRVNRNQLYVGGVGTSPQFRGWLEEENQASGLRLDFSDSGYGASDHMSFARQEIPVLFFFSGLHGDYHKPSDDWEKVQPEETAQVLNLVSRVAKRIDAQDQPLEFVRVERRRNRGHGGNAAPAGDPGGGGYGAYFGSIPDFAEAERGVRFADVREGGPAAQAGLRGGDILIQFDGNEVRSLYDFTYYLGEKQPGDEVSVVVLRDNQELRFTVTLGRRE